MNTAATSPSDSAAMAWHALAPDEVVSRLGSNAQSGLDAAEASRRLEKYGRNRLPEGARQGPFVRFLLHFNNVLVYVLLAAGFVKLMLGLWLDASIILAVVVAILRPWQGRGQDGQPGDPPPHRGDTHEPV